MAYSFYASMASDGSYISWSGSTEYSAASYKCVGIYATSNASFDPSNITTQNQLQSTSSVTSSKTFSGTLRGSYAANTYYYVYAYYVTTGGKVYLFGTQTVSYTATTPPSFYFSNTTETTTVMNISNVPVGSTVTVYFRLSTVSNQYIKPSKVVDGSYNTITINGTGPYTIRSSNSTSFTVSFTGLSPSTTYVGNIGVGGTNQTAKNVTTNQATTATVTVYSYVSNGSGGNTPLTDGSCEVAMGTGFDITAAGTNYQAYTGSSYNYVFKYYTIGSTQYSVGSRPTINGATKVYAYYEPAASVADIVAWNDPETSLTTVGYTFTTPYDFDNYQYVGIYISTSSTLPSGLTYSNLFGRLSGSSNANRRKVSWSTLSYTLSNNTTYYVYLCVVIGGTVYSMARTSFKTAVTVRVTVKNYASNGSGGNTALDDGSVDVKTGEAFDITAAGTMYRQLTQNAPFYILKYYQVSGSTTKYTASSTGPTITAATTVSAYYERASSTPSITAINNGLTGVTFSFTTEYDFDRYDSVGVYISTSDTFPTNLTAAQLTKTYSGTTYAGYRSLNNQSVTMTLQNGSVYYVYLCYVVGGVVAYSGYRDYFFLSVKSTITYKAYVDNTLQETKSELEMTNLDVDLSEKSIYTNYSTSYTFKCYTLSSSPSTQITSISTKFKAVDNLTVSLYFVNPMVTISIAHKRTEGTSIRTNSIPVQKNSDFYITNDGTGYKDCISEGYIFDHYSYIIDGVETGSYPSSTAIRATEGFSLVVYYRNKNQIAYFAWTNDDATNIAQGEPVTNITASAWRTLVDKISACGGTSGLTKPSSGDTITAVIFNQVRNAIANLPGVDSITNTVNAKSPILATMFANSYDALKEAINRAIDRHNS